MNQLPKSPVREIRTLRSVGAGGGRPPPATRWAIREDRPYRDRGKTPTNRHFPVRLHGDRTVFSNSEPSHGRPFGDPPRLFGARLESSGRCLRAQRFKSARAGGPFYEPCAKRFRDPDDGSAG